MKDSEGGERYVAFGVVARGKVQAGTLLRSQADVATQVALKRATAFSSFEMHNTPSGLNRVEIRGEGCGPDTCFLAWNRVSTVKVDRYQRQ